MINFETKDRFEVGNGYDIPSEKGGSVQIECVERTAKTATFEYNDGERVLKHIFLKSFDLKTNTECVKFGDMVVTA